MRRREFIAGLTSAAAWPVVARAQAYPTRPVRIIVAAAAAGTTDISARLMAQWLTERLGQSFFVENRPGGNSNIGTEAVVRAPADGYTLLMATSVNAVNASLYERLSYNFLRDTVTIAPINDTPLVMVVHSEFPAKSVPEFISYAKANSGKINIGSAGAGTPTHLTGELFKMATGLALQQVQYRGGGPVVADLLAGQVQVYFGVMAECIEYIRGGRLRALAVMSRSRSSALPDIPVMEDFLPGLEAGFWTGLAAPKNTPAEIIATLNTTVNVGLADPKLKARLANLGDSVSCLASGF